MYRSYAEGVSTMKPISSVLITGANRGLGLEFVKQFLKLNTPPKHIFAVCRSPDSSKELQELAKANKSLHLVQCEITDPDQHPKAVAEVKALVGSSGLDVLINNAGKFDWSLSDLQSHTKENMMIHLDINLVAPVLLTKAFAPLLKESGQQGAASQISAAVINISAILGCIHSTSLFPGGYPYKYTKAALNMATHCLAEDLKPDGVLVMALHPGWVRTDMGGPNGHLSVEESVGGCMGVICGLEEGHRGKLFDWTGKIIEY